MNKEELIEKLKSFEHKGDAEMVHIDADNALIAYIDDPRVSEAYYKIKRWYA